MKGFEQRLYSLLSQRDYYCTRAPEFLAVVQIGSPHPLPLKRVCPPRTQSGEQHSPMAGEGGGPNSDDWTKSLALCILCGILMGILYNIPLKVFLAPTKCSIIFLTLHYLPNCSRSVFFPLSPFSPVFTAF
jgi:hypothetical protein